VAGYVNLLVAHLVRKAVPRLTRHELKEQIQHDPFAESVAKVVDYTSSHRSVVVRWVVIAAVVALIAGGVVWYRAYARTQRQQDLEKVFEVLSAPVGPGAPAGVKSYPTEDAKRDASLKALTGTINQDGDSDEGLIVRYYRGTLNAQRDTKAAETDLKAVADSSVEVSSLAKIALAQLYAGENRMSDAQALLRSLIDKPNSLVSKEQAQIQLAQLERTVNPQEAKKILKQVKKDQNPVVARAVDELSAQLEQH
jgi:hypothetical protein